MKPYALSLENVYVAYNSTIVLSNLCATVPQGTMVAILGPNGAGKTTFIKTIIGLLQPLAGVITCIGLPFTQYQHHLAYIPQRMAVDWDFPIHARDVVLMGCYKRLGIIRRPSQNDITRAYELLEHVDMLMHAHTPIAELSGGQQQRIFLARALMQNATLLFLDEPFTGIDIKSEQKIMSTLHDLQKEGKTVFVVHHDLACVPLHFDWTILLNGSTIASGPTSTTLTPTNITIAYNNRTVLPYV
jgi:manganese/zinc/iron transport system ATP- binding protein